MRAWLREYLGIVDVKPTEEFCELIPVKIFVGNNNKSDEIACEGMVRGKKLFIWFAGEPEDWRGDEGRIHFEPVGIESLWRFGGAGKYVLGASWFHSERLGINHCGTARWLGTHVYPIFASGERNLEGDGYAFATDGTTKGWPIRTYYGLSGQVAIDIP